MEHNVDFCSFSLPDAVRYRTMTTAELRDSFLLTDIFVPGQVQLALAISLDRALIGGAVPTDAPLELPNPPELRAEFTLERREMGAINLGGPGRIVVDSEEFALAKHDALYMGRGSRRVEFRSDDPANPARFYLLSYPAHAEHPTALARFADANHVDLGSDAEANRRTIHQYIHENGVKSCQLVMGWTELAPGSVWNTMPPHTHDRRTEVYLYFDIAEGHRVSHQMGEPQETRAIWVGEGEAVLSPTWSIHCGCGTAAYSFVWGMGGENQRFDDMDPAPIPTLR